MLQKPHGTAEKLLQCQIEMKNVFSRLNFSKKAIQHVHQILHAPDAIGAELLKMSAINLAGECAMKSVRKKNVHDMKISCASQFKFILLTSQQKIIKIFFVFISAQTKSSNTNSSFRKLSYSQNMKIGDEKSSKYRKSMKHEQKYDVEKIYKKSVYMT